MKSFSLKPALRWYGFVFYIIFLISWPFAILWSWEGQAVGLFLSVCFLIFIRRNGYQNIIQNLNATPFSLSHNREIFYLVEELCRRLEIATPKLWVIDSPHLNIGSFGLNRNKTALFFTDGLLRTLPKHQLYALIGRELTCLWHKDTYNETWLALFLSFIEKMTTAKEGKHLLPTFIKQMIVYPIAALPIFLLKRKQTESELDIQTVKITRLPLEMTEAMRTLLAYRERYPLVVNMHLRHLFLLPPKTEEPMAPFLFKPESFHERIKSLEALTRKLIIPT